MVGGLIATAHLTMAMAGGNLNNEIRLDVSSAIACGADTNALKFELGTVDTPQQEIDQTQVVKLRCDAPTKVTLQGALGRGNAVGAKTGGAVPSLFGCETVGQQQCFDMTQAGHTFDVPAAGADVGIKVVYRVPAELGVDTFTGLLTVTWP